MKQPELFDGQELKEQGMKQALDNANAHHEKWGDRALEYLKVFPENRFMVEDLRFWAYKHGLPEPPHERAWGGVISKANKQDIVRHDGYQQVKAPGSHQAIASVWVRI